MPVCQFVFGVEGKHIGRVAFLQLAYGEHILRKVWQSHALTCISQDKVGLHVFAVSIQLCFNAMQAPSSRYVLIHSGT